MTGDLSGKLTSFLGRRLNIMKNRFLIDPLPPFGTPERRDVRVALLDYRDRLLSAIEKLVSEGESTESPKIQEIESRLRCVDNKLYSR